MSWPILNFRSDNAYSLTSFLIFVFRKREFSSFSQGRSSLVNDYEPSFYHLTHLSFRMLNDLSDFWISHPLFPLFNVSVAISAFSFSCPPTSSILILWPKPPSRVERWVLKKCVMPFSGLSTWVRQPWVGLEVSVPNGIEDSIIFCNLALQVRIDIVC